MTGQEATQILQKPLFGHPVCLDAKRVLGMVEELRQARKWAREHGLQPYEDHEFLNSEEMESAQLEAEIGHWRNGGFGSDWR